MPHPLLYEINTRCWLNQLSREGPKPVSLGNVPDAEYDRWQRLGFTHIWLMGVWRTGDRTRAEANAYMERLRAHGGDAKQDEPIPVAGSPYAVAEYRVSETLGGEAELAAFRRKLNQRGLKLILDYVPNHVGLDHPWLQQRPELFVQSAGEAPGFFKETSGSGAHWLAHGRDPNFPAWSDTVQLDYRVPETRAAMAKILEELAAKCDGVRCDMAMLVLNAVFEKTWAGVPAMRVAESGNAGGSAGASAPEFWQLGIQAARRKNPNFLFLAEAYWDLEERLQELGFDYTYDKELYDALAGRDAARVQRRVLGVSKQFLERSAHFLENHDEPRIASILSVPEQRAAALVILSLPGMRFLYDGQLTGASIRTPVQFLSCPVEPVRPDIAQMYEGLLLALQKTAVAAGTSDVLKPIEAWPGNPTAQNFVLVQWQSSPAEFDLAAINLAPHRSQCYAPLRGAGLSGHEWIMTDMLGSEEYRHSGEDMAERGVYLDLPEHGAQLFHFAPSERQGVREAINLLNPDIADV